MIENYDSVDVFIGVDVGKGEHHAVALNRAGKQLFDKALPNDEAKLQRTSSKMLEPIRTRWPTRSRRRCETSPTWRRP